MTAFGSQVLDRDRQEYKFLVNNMLETLKLNNWLQLILSELATNNAKIRCIIFRREQFAGILAAAFE